MEMQTDFAGRKQHVRASSPGNPGRYVFMFVEGSVRDVRSSYIPDVNGAVYHESATGDVVHPLRTPFDATNGRHRSHSVFEDWPQTQIPNLVDKTQFSSIIILGETIKTHLDGSVSTGRGQPRFVFWVPIASENGAAVSCKHFLGSVLPPKIPQLDCPVLRNGRKAESLIRIELDVTNAFCITTSRQ